MSIKGPNFQEFGGQVALVTGSSSGIGEHIARHLSDGGAHVVVNSSTSVEQGIRVCNSLSSRSIYVQADISDPNAADLLVDKTMKEFGRLDILVNNAGWTKLIPHQDLEQLTDEVFEKTFNVNVLGTWRLTRATIPHLSKSPNGNIINITSVAGVRPVGSSIAYSMSKAALNHMTVLLAKSFAPIRVNAIAPGLVETPWTATWQNQHENVARLAPLKRSATPEDCAQAALAILRNSYLTGQVIVVDGGLTLTL